MDNKTTLQVPKKSLPPLKWWQKLSLLGFSLILILLIEGIIRLCGYGGHYPLFERLVRLGDGSHLLQTNPYAQVLFFMNRTNGEARMSGSMQNEKILQPKPAHVKRIMYVGESTVQGFPHTRTLCSPAFLLVMLQQALPYDKIEVVNLGITAAASYPVEKIAEQALDYEPDLVIVYTGHNEYFGAFGVASLQSVGTRQWQLDLVYWLRGLGVTQLFYHLMDKWNPVKNKTVERKDLIEVMARNNSISINSPLRRAALSNLEQHINAITQACRQKKIPVVVCTLVSNEKDMAPLYSPEPGRLSPPVRAEWKENVDSGLSALQSSNSSATAYFAHAVQLFPEHGLTHYYYGKSLSVAGQDKMALSEYQVARDLDEMPWRASGSTNQMIRQMGAAGKAWVADAEVTFHNTEPRGIGWRLMADHLHPSMEGQALLAKSIYDTLSTHQWASLDRSTVQVNFDWNQLSSILGNNKMRQYEVASKMESLWSRPPLVRNNPLATPHFTSQLMAIESTCNDIEKKSILAWKKDWEQKGVQGDLCLFTADAYFEAGLIPYARPFYRSAWGQLPDYSLAKMLIEFKLLLCSDIINKELNPHERESARRVLADAKIIEQYALTPAQQGDFYRVCGGFHMLLKENQEAVTDFEKAYPLLAGKNRQQLSVSLAQTYLTLGQKNKAIDLLQKERNTTSWRGPEQLLNSILSPISPLNKKNLDTAP